MRFDQINTVELFFIFGVSNFWKLVVNSMLFVYE